jgi:hypothetical protein
MADRQPVDPLSSFSIGGLRRLEGRTSLVYVNNGATPEGLWGFPSI